jgi:hypothetical protein
MRLPSRGLLLLFFSLIAAFPSSAQDAEANLKFPPPPSAVEYDGKAWQELSSSTGAFAVLVPGKTEEKSGSMETQAGLLKIHVFPLLTSIASYVVSYTELPFTVTDPDAGQRMLDGAVKQVVGMDQNRLISESRISLEGSPGRRFEVEVPHLNCVVNGKSFLAKNRLYTLIITTRKYRAGPRETVEFYESVIGRFLNSFRFVDSNLRPSRTERGAWVIFDQQYSFPRPAVDLFVRCYNARQLRERKCPRHPAPLAAMI